MTEPDPRVDLLRGVYARWAEGDFATPEIFAPDVEVVWASEMPDSNVDQGLSELSRTMHRMFDAARQMTICAESIQPAGEHVLVMIEARVVGKGSGAETVQRGAHLWTMPGKLGTRVVGYLDRDVAREAAGLPDFA